MRKGFTLIEIVVVLAIIALGVGMAIVVVSQTRARQEASRALIDLAAALRKARSVARIAGPRIGSPRLTIGAGCTFAGPDLLVDVDPATGQVDYPADIQSDGAGGVVVTCATWTLPQPSGAPMTMSTPAAQFSFTSVGRLAAANPVAIQFNEPYSGITRGLLVLNSGLICESSSPPAAAQCD